MFCIVFYILPSDHNTLLLMYVKYKLCKIISVLHTNCFNRVEATSEVCYRVWRKIVSKFLRAGSGNVCYDIIELNLRVKYTNYVWKREIGVTCVCSPYNVSLIKSFAHLFDLTWREWRTINFDFCNIPKVLYDTNNKCKKIKVTKLYFFSLAY